jgi:hypothetical protein
MEISMLKFLILWGLLYSISQPVQAQEFSLPQRLLADAKKLTNKMPDDWLMCKKSSDCESVEYNCSELFFANKNHLKDVQNIICQTEVCSWLQCEGPYPYYYPACENNKCVTKISTSEVTKTTVTKS